MTSLPQGWYQDPYALHEDRYFSAGTATKLVRDDGRESYDPPPDRPLPDGDLVPVIVEDPETHGSDLHRADEACDSPPYDAKRALRAVLDVFDQTAGGGGI